MTQGYSKINSKNTSDSRLGIWFLIETVLTLISGVTFGKVYEEVPSFSAITQGQAQILFVSAVLFLVGIVGLIQILLYPHTEE